MEDLQGGKGCGKIGDAAGVAGAALGIASLVVPPVGVVGGLILAGSISLGVLGGGCGLAGLLS
ncbi:TPA: hypothetical protein L3261_001744 [Elizabethkingia anophelis]|nr:hypothetical protein [Elizabethkingia anophelis]HBN6706284.1 hypothetical protein [Elizabethkingia anophelis]HBN6710316.1 hypothetical protein [Elizabethkingia anophelis]HBN6713113.1 hypothetical protein [Elizabethkingia anophelis]HBN6718641.1 hypothetical protein [Elizabethkingia anophelis]